MGGVRERLAASSAGRALLFLSRSHAMNPRSAAPATPPTTPPAIAPASLFEEPDVGVLEGEGEEELPRALVQHTRYQSQQAYELELAGAGSMLMAELKTLMAATWSPGFNSLYAGPVQAGPNV